MKKLKVSTKKKKKIIKFLLLHADGAFTWRRFGR